MFVNIAAGIFQLGRGIYFGMYLEIWFGAILLVHGLFSVCCLLYDHTMGRYPKRTWGEHWKGGPLGKVNIHSPYRRVPVHSEDMWLLGIMWEGALYTPKIYNVIAEALEWVA